MSMLRCLMRRPLLRCRPRCRPSSCCSPSSPCRTPEGGEIVVTVGEEDEMEETGRRDGGNESTLNLKSLEREKELSYPNYKKT